MGKMEEMGKGGRTGCQTGLPRSFETKELGYRGTEDVQVKHAYACTIAGSEGKREVHLEESCRSVSDLL
jgi:hypothetical protein